MDNELILADICSVLRKHNKPGVAMPTDVAVERIRKIIEIKAYWIPFIIGGDKMCECSNCHTVHKEMEKHCPGCGAKMIKEDPVT